MHQDGHTNDFTETMGACTGPAQAKARWSPSAETGEWTQSPLPNGEAISN